MPSTAPATLVPLANTANLQGRRAADVVAGLAVTDRPVLGTAIVGVFGLQVASTGWSEKRLRAAGRPYRAIHTHPASHATYYPGADGMALKLLVDPVTDAILGAQGVGESGVDKRIDVLATAIAGRLPASALAELELAYAPPFSSAKDPVNMLGHVADNLRRGNEPLDPVARARRRRGRRSRSSSTSGRAGAHGRRRDPGCRARPARRVAGPRSTTSRPARSSCTAPSGSGAHGSTPPRPARARRAQPRRRLPHLARRDAVSRTAALELVGS